MRKIDLNKTFYLIASYWLGDLQGFIKIGDNKEEIVKWCNNAKLHSQCRLYKFRYLCLSNARGVSYDTKNKRFV